MPPVNVKPEPPEVLAAFGRLYAGFVSPGDLVFDVGANIGENTSIFLDLGAEVIAVEPLSEAADCIAVSERVHLVRAAAGPRQGTLELAMCAQALDMSSGSAAWISAMQRSV